MKWQKRDMYRAREVIGKPSTDRVKKRYEALLNSDLYLDSQRMRLYTGIYERTLA